MSRRGCRRGGFALLPALLLMLVVALTAQQLVQPLLALPQGLTWWLGSTDLHDALDAELAVALQRAANGVCEADHQVTVAGVALHVQCRAVVDEEGGEPVIRHHVMIDGRIDLAGIRLRTERWH